MLATLSGYACDATITIKKMCDSENDNIHWAKGVDSFSSS